MRNVNLYNFCINKCVVKIIQAQLNFKTPRASRSRLPFERTRFRPAVRGDSSPDRKKEPPNDNWGLGVKENSTESWHATS